RGGLAARPGGRHRPRADRHAGPGAGRGLQAGGACGGRGHLRRPGAGAGDPDLRRGRPDRRQRPHRAGRRAEALMASVAVARLRLKTPPDRAALATHRVTDALRLAPTGPERLLLVRRLALGRLSLAGRPAPWEARAAQALADHSSLAVHGASAGPDAQAVWFRSAAEARALLLIQLLAGRRPTAWFWRLAVPEWESLTLEAWLPRWIALAAREPSEEVALARAVIAAAVAGRLAEVLAAVAGSTPRLAGSAAQAASGRFDPPLAAA